MSPTLVRHQLPHSASTRCDDPPAPARSRARTRDWAEIQERMLVPLYEAAYDRLGIGPGTRLLGLGCGSGLALLLAAARGAQVSGVDADESRLELARERLTPDGMPEHTRVVSGGLEAAAPGDAAFNVVTAFHPVGCVSTVEGLTASLTAAAELAERGSAVVLGGWGPVERCATAGVLRVAERLADPPGTASSAREGGGPAAGTIWRTWRSGPGCGRTVPAGGLPVRVRGSGERGTGAAVDGALRRGAGGGRAAPGGEGARGGPASVSAGDGTVWMPNVFRYLIARTG